MVAFSKLAYQLGMPITTATCYETIHTWNPSCYGAIKDATPGGFLFSFKTYFSFYLVATLISKRGNLLTVDWKRFIRDVLQSSTFLTMNMVFFLWYLCQLRHALGFFTPVSMGLLSSWLASFCSILIEKPSRRPALALYLTNLASETLFRQLMNHGYLKPIPHSLFVPFSIGLGLFMYLYSKNRLPKSLKNIVCGSMKVNVDADIIDAKKLPASFHTFLDTLRNDFKKTKHCEHVHSCVSVSVEGFLKNFAMGFAASSALTLFSNLKQLKNPLGWFSMLFQTRNFKIPLFFGLLPLIFNTSRCTLNRIDGVPASVKNVLSGSLAGLSMLFFSNLSISMYCMWKAIETFYFDLVERGYLPKVPYGEIILYTLSTGYVLWQVVIEPHAIRGGYLGFLGGLVGNRFKIFNRMIYSEFGYHSQHLFNPKLNFDPRYLTINPMLYQPLVA